MWHFYQSASNLVLFYKVFAGLMCAAFVVLMLFPLIYEEQIQSFILHSNLHITLRPLRNDLGRHIENWTQWKLLLPGLQLHVSLLLPVFFPLSWLFSAVPRYPAGSSSTDRPQHVWAALCHSYLLAMDKVRICESLKHLKHLCRRCIEAWKPSETRHHICWLISRRYILMTLFCETITQTRPNKAARDARLSMTVISTCFRALATQTRLYWSVCFSQRLHLLTINEFLKQNLQRNDGCVDCNSHTGWNLVSSGWLHTERQS